MKLQRSALWLLITLNMGAPQSRTTVDAALPAIAPAFILASVAAAFIFYLSLYDERDFFYIRHGYYPSGPGGSYPSGPAGPYPSGPLAYYPPAAGGLYPSGSGGYGLSAPGALSGQAGNSPILAEPGLTSGTVPVSSVGFLSDSILEASGASGGVLSAGASFTSAGTLEDGANSVLSTYSSYTDPQGLVHRRLQNTWTPVAAPRDLPRSNREKAEGWSQLSAKDEQGGQTLSGMTALPLKHRPDMFPVDLRSQEQGSRKRQQQKQRLYRVQQQLKSLHKEYKTQPRRRKKSRLTRAY